MCEVCVCMRVMCAWCVMCEYMCACMFVWVSEWVSVCVCVCVCVCVLFWHWRIFPTTLISCFFIACYCRQVWNMQQFNCPFFPPFLSSHTRKIYLVTLLLNEQTCKKKGGEGGEPQARDTSFASDSQWHDPTYRIASIFFMNSPVGITVTISDALNFSCVCRTIRLFLTLFMFLSTFFNLSFSTLYVTVSS